MRKSIVITLALVLLLASGTVWGATAPAKTATPVKATTPTKTATVKVPADLGEKRIIELANDFISKNLVDGAKVEVKIKTKEANMYHLAIKIDGGSEISSAISANGKYFYPTVMDIEKIKNEKPATPNNPKTPTTPTVSNKSDKPVVELFVMSHCPYGTQIEKGIVPVLETLGSKINFQLKFVDYAMHGQKEIDEQLRQYCIGQEQSDKLLPYLKCFLEAGDSNACIQNTNVNSLKLKNCLTSTDEKFKINASYADKSGWGGSYPPFNTHKGDNGKYGVQGSPTLVINGKQVSSPRDSASLLATICSAFTKAPAECQAKLSSASPTPGFGYKTATASSASAGCGQ